MKIYLTGFMGAGKSTAGKKLASLLDYNFVDLDLLIEKETKQTITGLFQTVGDSKFREIESTILKSTSSFDNTVIACGGGTPCYHSNMEWMNEQGVTLFIQLTAGSLFHRLLPTKAKRPLLAGKTDIELMEFILETLKERSFFYKQAKYVIKGENLDVKLLVEKLKKEEPQLK